MPLEWWPDSRPCKAWPVLTDLIQKDGSHLSMALEARLEGKKLQIHLFSRVFAFEDPCPRVCPTSVIRGTAFKRSLDKQQWPQQACIIQMPVWPFRICRLTSIPCNSG